jgi:predicted AAA+ superfamily ATPase
MKYIHREMESCIKKVVKSFPCLAVTGPRQSGKSTLLMNILPDYNYITLDDPLERQRALSDPRLFLDTAGDKVIVDEIQWAPQLMSYIKMRVDEHRDKMGAYVFTGSQQFTMIKNLSDSLAGRIALLDLLPFSVGEKKTAISMKSTMDAFIHAALRTSYPEPSLNSGLDVSAWAGAYVQTYLERDVRSLYNIGNLSDFQHFLQLLASRCSQILNMSQFANDLGVSMPTIKSWLSILEAGRIIYLLPPYYVNLGKRITKSPKIYFLDIGLVCYLTGIREREHLMKGPLAGPLFENFCISETIKLFFNQGRRGNLYYLRTNNNLEIDLLIEESFETVMPVEIKLNKTPSMRMGSNISRFKELFSKLKIHDGRILSLTEKSTPLSRDISAVTLDDYLKQVAAGIQ